ncbi:MAG: GGDEF domain-containing protein [Sulfurovum sp.]|nr:MAG: GGDEF domain-containing protein [Sulfurovum sp.]
MLLSELEERERRFKLALRAGIPVLLLISLILYTVFLKDDAIDLMIENSFLIAGIIFITIYFIYFLLEEDVKKTLLDQTTQGFNQKAFIKRLQTDKPETLSLLIIKNLSTINENYGVNDVDILLHTIIQNLNNTLKRHGVQKSLIGRRYGAEFLIAVDNQKEDIQNILKIFSEENKMINNIEIDYGFSVTTNTEENLDKIILYLKDIISTQKKNVSESKEQIFTPDAIKISELEESVIAAIKGKNLLFTFRPLLNTGTDKVDIYEISVKLKSYDTGEILPKIYLPIINRLGLGREYDLEIVKHLIDLLPLIDDHISLTFNLSPFSLRDKTFKNQLFSYLKESHIDPSRLIIELYERKTHHNLSGYLKTLNDIRAKGIRICIDNFGSSNASMEYMKHFKFDMVQFDRDYVTDLEDKTTYAMLHSLMKMSKDLHIITVAKWVDKEDQKKKLKILGIDYLQGFGIGKPITETELINRYN